MAPEGTNPAGAVNFSKVSHSELKLHFGDILAEWGDTTVPHSLQIDVHACYYNWLMVKDGRALLSFT